MPKLSVESLVLNRIVRALEKAEISDEARARIVRYINDRFNHEKPE